MSEQALLPYVSFNVKRFLKDYNIKQISRKNLKSELEDADGQSGIDFSRPRVQTSDTSDIVPELAALRLNIENKLALIDSYFHYYDSAMEALTEDELMAINIFFNKNYSYDEAINAFEENGISKTQAYRLRQNALDKITNTLLG